jgi:hypothetical protein
MQAFAYFTPDGALKLYGFDKIPVHFANAVTGIRLDSYFKV